MEKFIEKTIFVNFVKKILTLIEIRDHCHLTGKYRRPAHSLCNISITQKQSIFIPSIFDNFSNYDCHRFFKNLVDKKNDRVNFKILPKTDEEYISVRYGCIRFIESDRF